MVRAARKFGCRLAVQNALDRVASCLDGQHVEDSRRGSEKLFVARVRCRTVPAVTFSCYNCKCRLNSETVFFFSFKIKPCCFVVPCCVAALHAPRRTTTTTTTNSSPSVTGTACFGRRVDWPEAMTRIKAETGKSYLLYAKLFEYDLCITLELVVKITY